MFALIIAFFVGAAAIIFFLRILLQNENHFALNILGIHREHKGTHTPIIEVSLLNPNKQSGAPTETDNSSADQSNGDDEIGLRKRTVIKREVIHHEEVVNRDKDPPIDHKIVFSEPKQATPLLVKKGEMVKVETNKRASLSVDHLRDENNHSGKLDIPKEKKEGGGTPTIGSRTDIEKLDKNKPIIKKLLPIPHNTSGSSVSQSPGGSPRKLSNWQSGDFKSQSIIHGWVEVRSKIGNNVLSKTVWHWRYMCLIGSWLCYFEDDECKVDDCCSWIKLNGCFAAMRDGKELMIKNPKHRIFHRHGPDPQSPPCKKKHFLFHRTSKRLIMKCGDASNCERWLQKLQEACTATSSDASTPVDSENDEMYTDGGVMVEDSTDVTVPTTEEEVTVLTSLSFKTSDSTVIDPQQGKVIVRQLTSSSREQPNLETIQTSEDPVEDPVNSDEEEKLNTEISKNPENREGLLKLLTKAVGLDITTISLPVSINEPTSFLQRMCECACFYDLLDKAAQCTDSSHRMTMVAAFAISLYSGNIRTTKPFNPLLGETFEYKKSKYSFNAEQVSHHPPIAACYGESPEFEYYQEQGLKTKFGGNSLACEGIGYNHVKLKKWGEHYAWTGIKTVVHNVVLGSLWVDHFGECEIKNYKTGETAHLEFTKCGWFSKGQYEVKVWIVDTSGKSKISIEGKWNQSLDAKVIQGDPLPFRNPIWVNTNQPDKENYWQLTPFAQELNRLEESMKSQLPVTDSRLRPDRLAHEMGDPSRAGSEKRKLEQEQRNRAKLREQRGEIWKPRYFARDMDEDTRAEYWRYLRTYWETKLKGAF